MKIMSDNPLDPLLQPAVVVIGHEETNAKRNVRDWISLLIKTMAAFVLMCYVIVLLLVAYRYYLHPPQSHEYGMKSQPPCDSPTRIVHVTGSERPKYGRFSYWMFTYNYITHVSSHYEPVCVRVEQLPHRIFDEHLNNGTFHRGDAVISVNGTNVEGWNRFHVSHALYLTPVGALELVIKNCSDALEKYEKCMRKYSDYRYIHYPYRPIDGIRRCEADDWKDVDTSSILGDLYRNILLRAVKKVLEQ